MLTFTKKAAKEMKDRISLSQSPSSGLVREASIGTFHNFCYKVLREHGDLVGLPADWTIIDQYDAEKLMSAIAQNSRIKPSDLLRLSGYARNSLKSLASLIETTRFSSIIPRTEPYSDLVDLYQQRCLQSGRVDFDDLQYLTYKLFTSQREIAELYRNRYKAILVDEYQDTSPLQSKILKYLDSGSNITVVGDDAQSIYGFRATTVQNILDFQKDFNAEKISLLNCYRCKGRILALAESSVAKNTQRTNRKFNSTREMGEKPVVIRATNQVDESREVILQINKLIRDGVPEGKIAVLYRAEALATAIKLELNKQKIPFKSSSALEFFASPHIKFVLDYLRCLQNKADFVAFINVMDLISGGNVQAKSLLNEQIRQKGKVANWDDIFSVNAAVLPSDLKETLRGMTETRNALVAGNYKVREMIIRALEDLSEPLHRLAASDEQWSQWEQDYGVLIEISTDYADIASFMATLNIDNIGKEDADDENSLSVYTIHSAKGLQWDYVFIVGLVEWWFPMNWAIRDNGNADEERRLFYVACTRARDVLTLSTFKKQTDAFGKERPSNESRFIEEIIDHVKDSR